MSTQDIKKQLPPKRRFSDSEFTTIKHNFADNEPLLIAIRKHFLQFPLTKEEQDMITNAFSHKDVHDIVSKVFLPTIDPDAPFGQIVDLWLTVKIDDKTPMEAYPLLLARETLINYLELRLFELGTGKLTNELSLESLSFDKDKDELDIYANMLARNTIVSHVEQQVFQLNTLAGRKDETQEETLKRLERDSSK